MIEPAIAYILLALGLAACARPVSTFVDHFITAFRAASHATATGRIRLPGDGEEDGPPKRRPFPRWALVPVAVLAVGGLVLELLLVIYGLRRYDSWCATFVFWLTQVIFIDIWQYVLISAIIWPRVFTATTTTTFPFSCPKVTWKRSKNFASPAAVFQTLGLILALLPLLASLEHYGWYNKFYWHRYRFRASVVVTIIQPVFGAVLFIVGTVYRQVFGDGEEDENKPAPDPEARGGYVAVVASQTFAARAPAPASDMEADDLLEGSDADPLDLPEVVTPPPVSPKA